MIMPRKAVLKLEGYSPPLSGRAGKLRLDFNENTLGCSPKVLNALRRMDAAALSVYPDYSRFKIKLSRYLGVERENIVLTNASDEAIKLFMDTFIEGGDEIILPVPTFTLFSFYAGLADAVINEVPYNDDLSFPVKRVINAITKDTKLVVLVSPNNPTGTAIADDDVISILRKAKENDTLIVIDEAYYEFCDKSFVNLVNDFDNLLVIRTFSKAFGLAGLRMGYLIGSRMLTKYLAKAQSPYSVNAPALIAAEAALADTSFVRGYVNEVKKNKLFVREELENLGVKSYPSDANFLIADFGERCGAVLNKLRDRGILVRDMRGYPLLKDSLRITIGTGAQCRRLIRAIRTILLDKVILFDMDGVLINVNNSYMRAIRDTAEFFTGRAVPIEEVQELKEESGYNNDWDLAEAIIAKRGKSVSRSRIITKFQEFYLGRAKGGGLIKNETLLLGRSNLRKLYGQYLLGIVTGRPRGEALAALKRYKLKDLFDTVISADDYPPEKSKPNPYPILLALEALNKSEGMYVGDSVDDMIAAKKANIAPIGCVPPGGDFNSFSSLLRRYGAVKVIREINQLMEVLR